MTDPTIRFRIEHALPILGSVQVRGKCTKYPFDRMLPGDSFHIRDYRTRWAVHRAASAYARRNKPYKFSIRRVQPMGWRCWRIQ